jgi:hypothetical protein
MQDRTRPLAGVLVLMAALSLGARHAEFPGKQQVGSFAPTALATTDLTQGVTPANLVGILLGPGITASNVTYNGAPVAAGTFAGGTGIIGFESGIVLGSGCISNIVGPNTSDSISCDNNLPGDPDLDLLSGFPTYDAAVLEFDFVPSNPNATMLLFSYVFSSDEYNEWVYTPYNDDFAFYVNGQNCALVPGLGANPDPVTIDTVNNGNPFGDPNARNPVLYRNNSLADGWGSINTEMDGLTAVLTCQAAITPNATNHIKLAIADASDHIYDSNVMIRAGSITSTDLFITLDPQTATNTVGTPHTVTATVRNYLGVPQEGHEIFFTVTSGPNAGATGTCSPLSDCSTNAAGIVRFTYTGGATPGTDIIRACFDDAGGNENCSQGVIKRWILPCGADGTLCDDQNPCTASDTCQSGVCTGTPITAPPEVDSGLAVSMIGGTAVIGWNPLPEATAYDVLRGLMSGLPVGPGGVDELCMGNVPASTLSIPDTDTPPWGDGFWYLVRGVNACGRGPYGYQGLNGVPTIPEVSVTCP